MVKKVLCAAAVATAIASLSGCQWLGSKFTDDKVQYQSSTSRAPLDIPPDLNEMPRTDRFTVPSRPQIVSANAEAAKERIEAEKRGDRPQSLMPQSKVAKMVRDGSVRYVHVKEPAERVWPVFVDFWGTMGLAIKNQDARIGVIQTEWAENKANLPQDVIRATLGKILDHVYDTGERDQYRARMERNDDGTTSIFVTHRSMVEVVTGQGDNTSTIWQPGAPNPELEAEMLSRLVLAMEAEFNPDAKPQEQRELDALAAVKYVPMSELVQNSEGVAEAVIVKEPFDRAWRRVGVGLDRAGFDVIDRDRTRGLVMIKYLDPDYEKAERAKQGFFNNLFSKAAPVDAVEYQIRLTPAGNETRVTVTGAEGRLDTTNVAPKIVSLIAEQTR